MKTRWLMSLMVALGATLSSAARAEEVLVLDVSMNAVDTWNSTKGDFTNFAANKRGDTFIVEGRIYPGGTIPHGDGVFGPGMPGSIGSWICRGVFKFDFDPDILAGAVPHVLTTQTFLLPDDGRGITTDGTEGGIPTRRVLVGGTGPCAGVRGEVYQEALGFSTGGLFNLRFTIHFRDVPGRCRLGL